MQSIARTEQAMSNPLTDVFTPSNHAHASPASALTGLKLQSTLASLNISFASDSLTGAGTTWPAMSRSALTSHVHRLRTSLASTLANIANHPVVTRAAKHPVVLRLAHKLNLPSTLVAALLASAAIIAASVVLSGKRVLTLLTTLIPITHSLRALETNDLRDLKSATKLWLLYTLPLTPIKSKPTYAYLLARLALLTYRPVQSANMAYALLIRPTVAAAVTHGVIPRQVAVSALAMDPAGALDVQARSPIDMQDVPLVVQKAVGLVVAARPEVGKYLGVEPCGSEAWASSEEGTGAHASPVARGISVGKDILEATGDIHAQPVHVRKTSGGGVLGLASVKLQQQLSGGGTVGMLGQMQQFVDADEEGQEVLGRGRASGRMGL